MLLLLLSLLLWHSQGLRWASHISPSSGPLGSLRQSYIKGKSIELHSHDNAVIPDKIGAKSFHHIEFYCGDATTTYKRFMSGLGMNVIAKSDQSTGNTVHASYCLESSQMKMLFSAPYNNLNSTKEGIIPGFHSDTATLFCQKHGLGVRAIAIEVDDVYTSYNTMIQNGGKSNLLPQCIRDSDGYIDIAEIFLYGDVVLRLINSKNYNGIFLPKFSPVSSSKKTSTYGIERFDHIVGNLWSLQPTTSLLKTMTGFHEFAEFVAEDVGTVDSGLNSVVLANTNEAVLLPLNEPTFGTKRKSQIQTYLEQNNGEGVQHIALFTNDIARTLSKMKEIPGGFEFMEPQPKSYYEKLPAKLGSLLSSKQYQQIEELGVLADKDQDDGVLLQVFTKPLGDRPTIFIEIIQRIGCMNNNGTQKPGCGGFGKGNFKDLFKSIEDYEKTLTI